MKDLAVSIDINEVTKRHEKVYFNNFFSILYNHYHTISFKVNKNNSNTIYYDAFITVVPM